jgi:hypothetical protein
MNKDNITADDIAKEDPNNADAISDSGSVENEKDQNNAEAIDAISDAGSVGDEKESSDDADMAVGRGFAAKRRSARRNKGYYGVQVLYIQMEYCEKTLSDVIYEVILLSRIYVSICVCVHNACVCNTDLGTVKRRCQM